MTTVAVVGLGTMGAGICEVVARHGFTVIAIDRDETTVAAGRERIEGSLSRGVARGKLTQQEGEHALSRITFHAALVAAVSADIVIEAIPETLDLKRALFADLDSIVGPDAILATNTSSLSVTDIAVATAHPARVVGVHFFNPAPVQKFVEVVRTVITAESVVESVLQFARALEKEPVVVGDRAGFIANALLFGYLNHAVSMYEQRYATREDIDAAMKFGCGLPMGPLALMDLIGLDTAYEILDTMYKEGRDRLHAPAPLLKHMVSAGLKGRKSGRGFYTYAAAGSPEVVPDELTPGATRAVGQARVVSRVGVVGSGTMASGIVEVCAKGGFPVVAVARSEEKARALVAKVEKSLARAVEKGKLTQESADETLARITPSATMESLSECDLIIEAVVEDAQVKVALFEELDHVAKSSAVLATTTSSLPVIDMAMATSRPSDVIGIHFFNPAAIMKLVEVVRTVATADDVEATALTFCEDVGKHAVRCTDRAGFIVNALLFPYLNDAVRMAEQNYATPDDIDIAMKLGCGYPMGPFELMDVVGLDVTLAIQNTLYREFRERGFAPAPQLEHLVTAGYLGRKTGRGFRSYA